MDRDPWVSVSYEFASGWGFTGKNWQNRAVAWLKEMAIPVQEISPPGFRKRWAYRQDLFHKKIQGAYETERAVSVKNKGVQRITQNGR
jgi:hypothetical protein